MEDRDTSLQLPHGFPYSSDGTIFASGLTGAFTFVTVRGGRHEVPETAPDRAFAMFQNFLAGTSF